jgi:hypothetical protein
MALKVNISICLLCTYCVFHEDITQCPDWRNAKEHGGPTVKLNEANPPTVGREKGAKDA